MNASTANCADYKEVKTALCKFFIVDFVSGNSIARTIVVLVLIGVSGKDFGAAKRCRYAAYSTVAHKALQ